MNRNSKHYTYEQYLPGICTVMTIVNSAYWTLCKPRVVILMLLTAWVGMLLSVPPLQTLVWHSVLWGMLGIGFVASCGGVINHLIDHKLDAKMGRTEKRPIPTGKVSPHQAIRWACLLGTIGLFILGFLVNVLTACLAFASLVGYAWIYTVFLKHMTSQNIVIGGLAGAMPPLLGWTAMTNQIQADALLLVLIIFTWTPPHFWALAIYRYDDYAKTQIPMLPVTNGIPFTKLFVVLYTLLMIAATLLPFGTGMTGYVYLVGTLILNAGFLYWAIRLYVSDDSQVGLHTFYYSIIYLFLLFIMMIIDHYHPVFLISSN